MSSGIASQPNSQKDNDLQFFNTNESRITSKPQLFFFQCKKVFQIFFRKKKINFFYSFWSDSFVPKPEEGQNRNNQKLFFPVKYNVIFYLHIWIFCKSYKKLYLTVTHCDFCCYLKQNYDYQKWRFNFWLKDKSAETAGYPKYFMISGLWWNKSTL
jgi:hypothetical protein